MNKSVVEKMVDTRNLGSLGFTGDIVVVEI